MKLIKIPAFPIVSRIKHCHFLSVIKHLAISKSYLSIYVCLHAPFFLLLCKAFVWKNKIMCKKQTFVSKSLQSFIS